MGMMLCKLCGTTAAHAVEIVLLHHLHTIMASCSHVLKIYIIKWLNYSSAGSHYFNYLVAI